MHDQGGVLDLLLHGKPVIMRQGESGLFHGAREDLLHHLDHGQICRDRSTSRCIMQKGKKRLVGYSHGLKFVYSSKANVSKFSSPGPFMPSKYSVPTFIESRPAKNFVVSGARVNLGSKKRVK
jgi:hypothetical protein